MRKKLRFILLWSGAFIIVILIGIMLLRIFQEMSVQVQKVILTHQRTIVHQVARSLESSIAQTKNQLVWLGIIIGEKDLNSPEVVKITRSAWENMLKPRKEVESLFILDREGIPQLVFPQEFTPLLKDYNLGRFLAKKAGIFKLYKWELTEGERADQKIIISAPFPDKVICASLSLKKIYAYYIQRIRTGRSGYSFLMDSSGLILASPISEQNGRQVKIFFQEERGKLVPLGEEEIQGEGVAKIYYTASSYRLKVDKILLAYVPINIEGIQWFVVVSTPYSEITPMILKSFSGTILLAVIVIALIFTAIVYLNDRLKMEEKLLYMSYTDGLTGLYNSTHLYEILEKEIERAKRYDHSLSLIMFDIDGFKNYNDTRGHLEGDKVLAGVGSVVKKSLREKVDSGYRYGGDEFVIILPETSEDEALVVAARLRASFNEMGFPNTSLSVGLVEYNGRWTVKEFIHQADLAMYKAKSAGGNQINVQKRSP